MFDNLVYDPIHVQEYSHEYEAYRVKVMARALLQEAEKCIWAEKAMLLCVKALQWLHMNAALFMGPVLEREFEETRQHVYRVMQPLNKNTVSLESLEQVLWRRVPRKYANWALPRRVDRPEDLWQILQHITDKHHLSEKDEDNGSGWSMAKHALFAMLCVDWLLHNPELLLGNAKLCGVLQTEMRRNPILADMYGRQMARLNLPIK
jgi:hypothetical protein